ncbi:MAG: gliding motility-associated C-terminal domain-containing protein [Saprospirales bacterium]|nr:gliding motility-associated C-terminal domain-containing protein [Saprospirales bacterium]
MLWKRTYGSPGKTCLRSVARGNFGGYVAVGMTEGNIASPNESFITWLDDEGKPLKARLYDPAEGFHFDELIRTPGGYALAGTADAPQGTGILLAKMDEAGNTGLCTTAPAQLSSTLSTIPSTPVDETPAQAPEISTGQAASANLVLQEILRCAYACDTLVIQPEICNNNLDDDGDGLFDCLDPDCDCPENACAPGQALTWYFGRGSGLDFSTGPPSVLTGGQTDNLMSSAVANDAKGNLLFYSDGKTVYNRFHQPMPNGQLQTGAGPAQCESIILPHPGNSKIFYLATAAAGAFGAPALVSYSVIDISLDGGRGDVAAGQKLLPLWPGGGKVLPRIAAVRSCFFNGYWLVLRAYEPQAGFLSFRLDPGGLKTTPVVSAAGAIPAVFGQMKLSPDGLLLAETDQQGKSVCVYNFDPYSSGKVSAVPRFVANLPYAPFGLEFSPKGRLLYVSVWDESPATFHSEILQFDLQTAGGPDISTNAAKIAALPGTSGIVLLGAMQLGPDGKIYVSSTTATNQFKTNLHVIHWPEKSGSACHFQENALSLAPPPGASAGLCNFPASLFASPHIAFPANAPDTICRPGQTALYQITDVLCNVNTITWTLEGLPGTVQSNYQYASILYTEPGEGRLILTAHTGCGSVSDTMRVFVFDDPPPPKLDLGPDRVVCDNGVYRFEAGGGFARYRWQDGSSDSIYTTTLPGRYWVDAWDRCGNRQTDTITVTVAPATVLDLGPDWQGCPGTTLAYIRPAIFSRWQWLPAGFLSCDTCAAVQTAPAANRTYQIIAQTAGGCISVDTLTFTPYDTIFVVLDTFICQNETLELLGITLPADTFAQIFQPAAGAGRCDTLWQIAVLGIELATGSFDTVICAGATLFYQGLQIEAGASAELLLPGANGCDSILTIKVGAFLPLSASLPPDTTLRIGDTLMLEPEVAGAGPFAYSWAPEGSAPCANCPAIWVSPYQSLWYALAVSDANGCQAQDSIFVAVDSVCRLFPVTAFTPDNDGNNDWFYPKTDPCVRTVLRWQIANRWGQVVFERQHFIPNQESMGWDGRHNGQEAPSDVYIWRAELEYYDGKKTGVKGAVTVLR